MTVASLTCDVCGRMLAGSAIHEPANPGAGVRLLIHPGDPLLKDDSVLVCLACWEGLRAGLGPVDRADVCAVCAVPVSYDASLHVIHMTGRIGEAPTWQLCRAHAVGFLNGFRFVDPKLGPGDLALKADFPR